MAHEKLEHAYKTRGIAQRGGDPVGVLKRSLRVHSYNNSAAHNSGHYALEDGQIKLGASIMRNSGGYRARDCARHYVDSLSAPDPLVHFLRFAQTMRRAIARLLIPLVCRVDRRESLSSVLNLRVKNIYLHEERYFTSNLAQARALSLSLEKSPLTPPRVVKLCYILLLLLHPRGSIRARRLLFSE